MATCVIDVLRDPCGLLSHNPDQDGIGLGPGLGSFNVTDVQTGHKLGRLSLQCSISQPSTLPCQTPQHTSSTQTYNIFSSSPFAMIYRFFLEALSSLRSRVLRTLSPTPAAANLKQLHSNGRALLVDQLKFKYAPVFGDEWESRISAQDRAKMRYWELRGATRLARRKPKLIHGDNWEAAALAKQNQEQACNTAPALKARPFLLEGLGIKPATPSQMNTIKARHDVFERHCIDIHNHPPGTQKALQAEIDALFQQLQALRSPEE